MSVPVNVGNPIAEEGHRSRPRVNRSASAGNRSTSRADNPVGWPVPGPDGCFTLSQAARAAGVDRSYLRRIAVTEAPPAAPRADGRAPQYILGDRDGHGRWRFTPAEV